MKSRNLKSYMMPIAMLLGVGLYPLFSKLAFITPWLIFIMLFITYTKLDFKKIRLVKMHLWLILFQIIGSIAVYLLLHPVNEILAQGIMICILVPTATSAPVITHMLKGNVENLTAYMLLSNLVMIILAPLLFSYANSRQNINFLSSFLTISEHIVLLLLGPLMLALILKQFLPRLSNKIGSVSGLSFYIWTVALIIVTARTAAFIVMQGKESFLTEILLAVGTLVVCLIQFFTGKFIGRAYGETIAGGQSLGQKNTVLAIWMAQTYLIPLSSVGPGAYVIWQNIFNSLQVWRKRKQI